MRQQYGYVFAERCTHVNISDIWFH